MNNWFMAYLAFIFLQTGTIMRQYFMTIFFPFVTVEKPATLTIGCRTLHVSLGQSGAAYPFLTLLSTPEQP